MNFPIYYSNFSTLDMEKMNINHIFLIQINFHRIFQVTMIASSFASSSLVFRPKPNVWPIYSIKNIRKCPAGFAENMSPFRTEANNGPMSGILAINFNNFGPFFNDLLRSFTFKFQQYFNFLEFSIIVRPNVFQGWPFFKWRRVKGKIDSRNISNCSNKIDSTRIHPLISSNKLSNIFRLF